MRNSVKIKDVERTSIWMKEINVSHHTWIYYLIWGILISGMVMVAILFGQFSLSGNVKYFFVSVVILGGLCMVQMFLCVGEVSVPAYEISLMDIYGVDIIIEKVSPEKDQVAICNATKELEQKARQYSKKIRDLEQIACKCK